MLVTAAASEPDDAFVSDDARELRDAVARLTVPHSVECSDGRIDGLARARRLARANLVFVRYGADVIVEAAPAGDRFGLTLPLGPMSVGHTRLAELGSRESSFVLSRERRTLMVPDPHAGAIVVAADTAHIHRHLCDMLGYDVEGPVDFGPDGDAGSALPRGYLDAVVSATWTAASATVELPAASARLLEQNLLTALLLGLPHSHSRLLRAGPARASTVRVLEARRWMEEHYAEPVGVRDVARAVGSSVRRLQAVFAQEHGCSPMDVLRDIRLDRARRLLTEGAERPLTVTEVAVRCGVGHLGRFAGAYRARFGESPSETLGRRAATRG